MNLELFNSEDSVKSLTDKAKDWKHILSLKKLHIGGFLQIQGNKIIESTLVETLVIHPMSKISELLLKTPQFKDSLTVLQDKMK